MSGLKVGDKRTTIHRKPNGAAYLYSVDSYWDKEKKQPRNKQVCLGRINDETGEVERPIRKPPVSKGLVATPDSVASTKVYGPYLLLTKLAADIGLTTALMECFPDTYSEILSLAFFLAQKGIALSRCELWSVSHAHPFGKPIDSQRVSELLQQMTENERQRFLGCFLDA